MAIGRFFPAGQFLHKYSQDLRFDALSSSTVLLGFHPTPTHNGYGVGIPTCLANYKASKLWLIAHNKSTPYENKTRPRVVH
jgi:hypothetical protein